MSSDRYRGDSNREAYRADGRVEDERDDRYDRYGRRPRTGPSSEGQSGSGRDVPRWDRDSYRGPGEGFEAEAQADGEPYRNRRQDWEPSGGPARLSREGMGGFYGRGSRSFDGYERGFMGRGPSGGGYGEYSYREEDSPRGRSMRGGGGPMFDDGSYGFGSRSFGSPSPSGEMRPGRFSGKGPKGYQRSDERIREDASDVLERHGEIDASEIVVSVASGEITLEGTVHDRASKRLAEDLIENLAGVKEVHNRLRVGGILSSEKSSDAGSKSNAGKPSGSTR